VAVDRDLTVEAFAEAKVRGTRWQCERPVFFCSHVVGDVPDGWYDVEESLDVPGEILDEVMW